MEDEVQGLLPKKVVQVGTLRIQTREHIPHSGVCSAFKFRSRIEVQEVPP